MDPQGLFAYLTGLLRSEPEVIASFLMGGLFAGMLILGARRWASPSGAVEVDLARREADLARRDARLARLEALLAGRGESPEDFQEPSARPRRRPASVVGPEIRPPSGARLAQLEAENRRLAGDVQALREELARSAGELAHWAKWSRRLDDENARLVESQAGAEG